MGGLSVINVGFLAAGAAFVAVPVVIHLLFRQKAVRVEVGSLRFLKIALQDNARRRKVRRWLLFLLRVASALLLGFLFARPYRFAPEVPGRDREVVILIDSSASMGAGESLRSPFGKARDAARTLINTLPDGTAVSVALFDTSGVTPIPIADFNAKVRTPSPTSTDFAKGLAWARDRMVESTRKAKEVHLYTDLQRVGLDRPTPEDLPEGTQVEIVDVGRPIAANLAIEDARTIRTEIRDRDGPLISVRVRNYGSFPARDVEVRLNLLGGGKTFPMKETITIDGSSSREVRFAPSTQTPELYQGTVELARGDELPFDDRRYLGFAARSPERIWLVDGEAGATVYANETYYLEAALRLRVAGTGPSATPFEPRRIAWDSGLAWPDLRESRVVVLANVPDVDDSVAESLRSFVDAGGSLLLFSGGRVEPGAYAGLKKRGLLPGEVEGVVDGPIRLDSWVIDHPLFQPFRDAQHGDLRSLTFQRVARLKPVEGSSVLASTRSGLPLLLESRVGRGRILQFAAAADNEWGDWAVQRLYLPVIHQMMGYLTDRLSGSGSIQLAASGPNAVPGIESIPGGLVVRNVDPSESAIDRASIAEFRERLRLPESAMSLTSKGLGPIPDLDGVPKPGEFWRAVAWVLLVLLVVETFVANRTSA